MTPRLSTRRGMALASACLVMAAIVVQARRQSAAEPPPVRLHADGKLRWYKGNLHTHSLWSDGDAFLESIALWYREHDYQFLAFTDHNVLAASQRWIDVDKAKAGKTALERLRKEIPDADWIEERTVDGRLEVRLKTFAEVAARYNAPGKFLLIQGEEISDRFGNLPVHLNATNVQQLIPPLGGESVADILQKTADAVESQRARTGEPVLLHLNHPNFHYGVTAEDLLKIRGENFFEVYNGHPTVNNEGDDLHAGTERIWDILLTRRLGELGLPVMYGLATDDGHEYHKMPSRAAEPGRGWIMVLADELTPAALITAIEQGRFYASSGVTLSRIECSDRTLTVEVKPDPGVEYKIEFIGTRAGYDAASEPIRDANGKEINATRRYSADVGKVFAAAYGTRARYRMQPDDLYVRARVTSSRKHPNPGAPGEFERAWVQPWRGPAAMAARAD